MRGAASSQLRRASRFTPLGRIERAPHEGDKRPDDVAPNEDHSQRVQRRGEIIGDGPIRASEPLDDRRCDRAPLGCERDVVDRTIDPLGSGHDDVDVVALARRQRAAEIGHERGQQIDEHAIRVVARAGCGCFLH